MEGNVIQPNGESSGGGEFASEVLFTKSISASSMTQASAGAVHSGSVNFTSAEINAVKNCKKFMMSFVLSKSGSAPMILGSLICDVPYTESLNADFIQARLFIPYPISGNIGYIDAYSQTYKRESGASIVNVSDTAWGSSYLSTCTYNFRFYKIS